MSHIQPGKPQQNAYVERYNRTVRHEWLDQCLIESIEDNLGYLPFSVSGEALLSHRLSKLFERTSVVIATNLSFSEWATVFGDAKMDDRSARSFDTSLPYHENLER